MDCEAIREELSGYLDGELPSRDCEVVKRHLDKCPECANELSATQRLMEAAVALESVEPPRYLRRRIALSTVSAPPSLWCRIAKICREALKPVTVAWTAAGSVVAAAIVFTLTISVSTRQPTAKSHVESTPVAANANRQIPSPPISVPAVTIGAVPQPSAGGVRPRPASARKHVSSSSARTQARPVLQRRERSRRVSAAAAPHLAIRKAPGPVVPEQPTVPQQETINEIASREEPKNNVAVNGGSWNTREEGISGSTGKTSMAEVVADELSSTTEDDEAMIRSLKRQPRMQRSGDGISVDVVGVRF